MENDIRASDEGMTIRDDPHFITFSSATGEEIARIDVRTGEVTYKSPDAGKEAADIFWICFSDRIMEMIEGSQKDV